MDIAVTHVSGDRFAIQVRGHRLVVDQPVADGGQDAGPTPTELFVGSLAACVAFYARRFLARHDLDGAIFARRPRGRGHSQRRRPGTVRH